MTTYLAVLLLLGLIGPGTATALDFDSYSMSAFIQPPFTNGGSASLTATTPDFRLGLSFSSQSNIFPFFEFVGFRCIAPGIFGMHTAFRAVRASV